MLAHYFLCSAVLVLVHQFSLQFSFQTLARQWKTTIARRAQWHLTCVFFHGTAILCAAC